MRGANPHSCKKRRARGNIGPGTWEGALEGVALGLEHSRGHLLLDADPVHGVVLGEAAGGAHQHAQVGALLQVGQERLGLGAGLVHGLGEVAGSSNSSWSFIAAS